METQDKPLQVVAFGESDIGLVRGNNEDSFLITDLTHGVATCASTALDHVVGEKGILFLVADGMGGAEAGEVASQMAVEVVSREVFENLTKSQDLNRPGFVEILKQAIQRANEVIHEESLCNQKRQGMGTTLTAAAVYDAAIFFAQVGDSRGYLVRNGAVTQMTRDQSLIAHLVASGAVDHKDARNHPQRNVILQAIGVAKQVDVAVSYAELKRNDRAVLCSDGLSGKIDGEELQDVMEKWQEPKEACGQLITIARERGGEDNITVIVVKFEGEGLPPPTAEEQPTYQEFKESKRRGFWPWSKNQ
ncbi:MAG: Stp1/IreP family PP2C-type Ser/Thr phosphatase [Deltaproteobacteria bacterium]|nr:Stp1/IreP family PP2C-type Ser/Thr phosphatase [Deltaproteobacteria bacterium]